MPISPEQNWIFLASMPRSGSSWIAKLIDSHRDVLYFHEPDGAGRLQQLPLLAPTELLPNEHQALAQKLNEFVDTRLAKVICSLPIFKKNYMSFSQHQAYVVSTYLSKVTEKLIGKSLIAPMRLISQRSAKTHLWKTVESCGRLELLSNNLPNCTPIHLLRNPCGQINSTFSGEKRKVFVSATPIYEDWDLYVKLLEQSSTTAIDLNDIKAMAPEERLAWRWRIINDKAWHETQALNGIKLKYEDVCERPAEQVQQLFEKLNLVYGDSTHNFIVGSTSKTKDAYYSLTKDPFIAANKWRDQLETKQIERVVDVLKDSPSFSLFSCDF